MARILFSPEGIDFSCPTIVQRTFIGSLDIPSTGLKVSKPQQWTPRQKRQFTDMSVLPSIRMIHMC